MDAILLVHCPTPADVAVAKRPCSSAPDPTSATAVKLSKLDRDRHVDSLLDSFLNLASDSSAFSLDLSFDRLLHSRASDSDQTDLIERALNLGSVLLEAGKRSARKRASMHNAVVWPLSPDLTFKIFSMIDTQSLCYAAATCSFFRKCALDPTCYANIDLTAEVPKVNNLVVATMIQRAGTALQSLKLGLVPGRTTLGSSQPLIYSIRNLTDASGFSWNDKRFRQGKESSILTRSCLITLNGDGSAPGYHSILCHLEDFSMLLDFDLMKIYVYDCKVFFEKVAPLQY
ncbi:hypothetical protein RJ639_004767 [Escallonia herrerae]|uniref:F-box domain-containing protein n=1 Tax=Escallonia herrerae TaxID=1293975 RepID=A0AA88W1K2_9ASTE|nr:hypothetical protein RJ639_004767 [Escallonia herrerae]